MDGQVATPTPEWTDADFIVPEKTLEDAMCKEGLRKDHVEMILADKLIAREIARFARAICSHAQTNDVVTFHMRHMPVPSILEMERAVKEVHKRKPNGYIQIDVARELGYSNRTSFNSVMKLNSHLRMLYVTLVHQYSSGTEHKYKKYLRRGGNNGGAPVFRSEGNNG